MDDSAVKEEPEDFTENQTPNTNVTPINICSIDSEGSGTTSDSSDESNGDEKINKKRKKIRSLEEIDGVLSMKKPKIEENVPVLEEQFSIMEAVPLPVAVATPDVKAMQAVRRCKQFWKAGDYEGEKDTVDSGSQSVGMDCVRIHPKFLHSNATSHKWAFGAFAELLDNALDEVINGANFIHINPLNNKKSASKMLMVEDNGGGMTPAKMRQCMSLGYSSKSKIANTIGQYGNGFKTSTMRLGADVIVFSCCAGNKERSTSRSIGMLSYTFLTATGKEDIIVPMIDYEKSGQEWTKMIRSSPDDWKRNLEMILQWSPFESEEDLHQQFNLMQNQGTRVIIYNLWEDDEGKLELDFDTDPFDIQIRGVNRDEKKIKMAKHYPNSRHFLTYNHSLRSYASILYLRLPPDFRIILRGKDVEHHNLVNDMIYSQTVSYKPHHVNGSSSDDSNMTAVATVGFVKDAHFHIDVQGFNVYHKNRLIKPFWRVWNAAGSDGRGVIGVLEANFVEPAHDKQGFERTIVLSRLEARLVTMQRNYWNSNCHFVGYAARGPAKKHLSSKKQVSQSKVPPSQLMQNGHGLNNIGFRNLSNIDNDLRLICVKKTGGDKSISEAQTGSQDYPRDVAVDGKTSCIDGVLHPKDSITNVDVRRPISAGESIVELEEERHGLQERLRERAGPDAINLLHQLQFERERRRSLEKKLVGAEQKIKDLEKEQLTLINLVVEERTKGEEEEEKFRKQLMEASVTIDKLLEKLKWLQGTKLETVKLES